MPARGKTGAPDRHPRTTASRACSGKPPP